MYFPLHVAATTCAAAAAVLSQRCAVAAAALAAPAATTPAAGEHYALGSYTVLVDRGGGSVEVRDAEGEGVWVSHPSTPLIAATTNLTTLSSSSGNIEIDTSPLAPPYQSPVIERVVVVHGSNNSTNSLPTTNSSSTLTLAGSFADHAAWTWELRFSVSSPDSPSNPDEGIRFEASVQGAGVANVFLSFASPRGEQWFGFGGLAGLGDLRGQRIPILTREAGVGRGAPPLTHLLNSNASLSGAFAGGSLRTAYTAIGAGTTSHGRWLALAGAPALTVLDLASARSVLRWPLEDTADAQQDGLGQDHEGEGAEGEVVRVLVEGQGAGGWIGRAGAKKKNGAANAAVNATANPVLSALTALSRRTGRQPRLPAWTAQGSILGIQGGQNKTAAIVQRALAAKTPLAAVWLQDWSGARLQPGADYAVPASRLWWNWEADAERYPQWATWVPALRGEHGVRVLSYVNTFLADVSAKTSGWERNLFEEGSAKGLLVGNKSADDGAPWRIESGPGIDAGLLDLSNEAAVRWFKQVLKDQFYSVPISGMMQDFGEYLPTDADAQLGGDVDPRLFHNAYPAAWAKLLREVVEELDLTDEQLGFHRSATTFSGPHTNLFWAGDQNVDTTREDGMRAAASTALQMGFSGWGQIHSDVGGYTTTLSKKAGNVTRDAALLGRWGEMVALTDAVMRSHEGNIPDVNAQAYDNASTLAYWAYNSRLFVSVAQYRAQLLDEYHDRGWPVARHPVVYAPGDARAQSVVDEAFWVGEALLLAPVYEVWEQKVEVYLPHFQIDSEGRAVPGETKYRHLWSGEEYAPGQSVVVDAPWGRPGVFVRWPLKESEEETLKGLFEFVEKERETVLSV